MYLRLCNSAQHEALPSYQGGLVQATQRGYLFKTTKVCCIFFICYYIYITYIYICIFFTHSKFHCCLRLLCIYIAFFIFFIYIMFHTCIYIQSKETLLQVILCGDSPECQVPSGFGAVGQPNDGFHAYVHSLVKSYSNTRVQWTDDFDLRRQIDAMSHCVQGSLQTKFLGHYKPSNVFFPTMFLGHQRVHQTWNALFMRYIYTYVYALVCYVYFIFTYIYRSSLLIQTVDVVFFQYIQLGMSEVFSAGCSESRCVGIEVAEFLPVSLFNTHMFYHVVFEYHLTYIYIYTLFCGTLVNLHNIEPRHGKLIWIAWMTRGYCTKDDVAKWRFAGDGLWLQLSKACLPHMKTIYIYIA